MGAGRELQGARVGEGGRGRGAHLLQRLSTCQLSAALCGLAQWQARTHADHAPREPQVHADRRRCRAAVRPRGPKRGARSPRAYPAGASARAHAELGGPVRYLPLDIRRSHAQRARAGPFFLLPPSAPAKPTPHRRPPRPRRPRAACRRSPRQTSRHGRHRKMPLPAEEVLPAEESPSSRSSSGLGLSV